VAVPSYYRVWLPPDAEGRIITPWHPAIGRRLWAGAVIFSWGEVYLGEHVLRHPRFGTALVDCRADTVCSCVSCNEVHRLLHEYDAAVVRLLQALEHGGSSPVERKRWDRIAERARRICGQTMAAIQMQLGHCVLLTEAAPTPSRGSCPSVARRR
jgi:hypothetical protein